MQNKNRPSPHLNALRQWTCFSLHPVSRWQLLMRWSSRRRWRRFWSNRWRQNLAFQFPGFAGVFFRWSIHHWQAGTINWDFPYWGLLPQPKKIAGIFQESFPGKVFKQDSQEGSQATSGNFQGKVSRCQSSEARFANRPTECMSIAKWDSKARVSTACNLSVQSCYEIVSHKSIQGCWCL